MQNSVNLNSEDVADFISANVKNNKCMACDNDQWHILIDPEWATDYIIPALYTEKDYLGLNVVILCCAKCGYIRMHAGNIIKAWKEENGA